MAKRRKYSEEFKREAVGLTQQPGANVSQVARALKRELAKVKRERDFLRDAAAFFARESK
jgi:transposase